MAIPRIHQPKPLERRLGAGYFKCFLIFDGTGPSDPETYRLSFENSFCSRQIYREVGGRDARYFRASLAPKRKCGKASRASLTTRLEGYARDGSISYQDTLADRARVFLVGHSRGGSSAISCAEMLKEKVPDLEIRRCSCSMP